MSSIGKEVTSKAIGLIKDKGKDFDESNTRTIKLLADVKVVFIVTHIYVSVVNLISSTARSEVLNDEDCDNLYNVSSALTAVPVRFINNAVLWGCRDQSPSNFYYESVYWMLIIALITVSQVFTLYKLIALCTLCCSPEHVLTKLWHLAIISGLIEKIKKDNEQDLVTTDHTIRVGIADRQRDMTNHDQQLTTCEEGRSNTHPATEKLGIHFNSKNEEFCKRLLHQDIPHEQISKCKWRKPVMTIPIILLVLMMTAMGISLLSYDLHPLGCLLVPDENDINYKNTTKSVDIDFPVKLQDFQIAAGFSVVFMALVYVFLALVFYLCSRRISSRVLGGAAKDHIERELEKFNKT